MEGCDFFEKPCRRDENLLWVGESGRPGVEGAVADAIERFVLVLMPFLRPVSERMKDHSDSNWTESRSEEGENSRRVLSRIWSIRRSANLMIKTYGKWLSLILVMMRENPTEDGIDDLFNDVKRAHEVAGLIYGVIALDKV